VTVPGPALGERQFKDPTDERLAQIRDAILRGEYVVDARLVAERLIASGVLRRAAKA
jgi:anti-sigma28 factor (negative regulator of flagellin synthesis)